MKCLVMSLIVIVNMGINLAFATVPTNDFAYNSEPADSTGVETQYIYRKTDNGRYLRHHLKYRCTYDDAHRLLAREVLRWDANLMQTSKTTAPPTPCTMPTPPMPPSPSNAPAGMQRNKPTPTCANAPSTRPTPWASPTRLTPTMTRATRGI